METVRGGVVVQQWSLHHRDGAFASLGSLSHHRYRPTDWVKTQDVRRGHCVKILIVDDHEATVAFMRLAFVGAGHAVTTASKRRGRSCVTRPRNRPTWCSRISHFGESGGGSGLARSLRSAPSTSCVGLLAVSGADAPEVLQATLDSGFDGFVSKPVDLASLLHRVDRLAVVVATRRASEHQVDGA